MSPGQRATVLIVEDDEGIALLEQTQLERAGYAVITAATVPEAWVQLHQQPVDLVLLDYCLPGEVDGLDVFARMKAAGFDLPVILVTGFGNETLAVRALRAGVRDFVTKSAEYLDYLPEAVQRVLQQVHTEHRLAESEARLALVIASAKDAILLAGADHQITLFNQAAEEMFRCPAHLALELPVQQFLLEESGRRPRSSLLELVAHSDHGLRTDGSAFPLEASVSQAEVNGQKLYTVIIRDITERKQQEEALRQSETRLREMLDGLPVAAWTCDAAGLITYFNQSARELWGRSPQLLDSQERFCGTWKCLHPDNIPLVTEPCLVASAVSRNCQLQSGEFILERPDGSCRTVLLHSSPLGNSLGQPGGAVNVLVDITERRRMEMELRRSEKRFRSLVRASTIEVWVGDAQGESFHLVSPEGPLPIPGPPLSLGQWLNRFHPDDRGELASRWTLAVAQAQPFEAEARDLPPAAPVRHLALRGVPVRDCHEQVLEWVVVLIDITEHKQAQAERDRLAAVLHSTCNLVVMADANQRLTYINPAGRRLLALDKRTDFPSMTIPDFHPPARKNAFAISSFPPPCRTVCGQDNSFSEGPTAAMSPSWWSPLSIKRRRARSSITRSSAMT